MCERRAGAAQPDGACRRQAAAAALLLRPPAPATFRIGAVLGNPSATAAKPERPEKP